MNLDRRRSHTGLPARRPSVQQPSQQQHSSHKRSPSPRGSMVGQSSMLLVPNSRPRGSSLPGNIEVVNQDDIYRLRNFSTSGKKLVNRGDSLKARSHTSIASTNSRYWAKSFFFPFISKHISSVVYIIKDPRSMKVSSLKWPRSWSFLWPYLSDSSGFLLAQFPQNCGGQQYLKIIQRVCLQHFHFQK